MHHVSAATRGELCSVCKADATHKLGEEIMFDDPMAPTSEDPLRGRHNLTAYVCCRCFTMVLGPATGCPMPVCTCGLLAGPIHTTYCDVWKQVTTMIKGGKS